MTIFYILYGDKSGAFIDKRISIKAYRHSFFNPFYTNSQLKCLTERIRFFVLTKPSEVRRTGGTLNGTRQSQSEKDGARIKPF